MTRKSKLAIVVGTSAIAAALASSWFDEAADGRRIELAGDEVGAEAVPPASAGTETKDESPLRPSSPLAPQAAPPALRPSLQSRTIAAAGTQEGSVQGTFAPATAVPESIPTRTEILQESADGGTRHPIDRDGIRAAVAAAMPQVRECYEEWIRLQPDLGGKVKVVFTIDTDDGETGKVESVSLGDAGMGHLGIESCILAAFEELRFEAPLDGPINVTYPLSFSSR